MLLHMKTTRKLLGRPCCTHWNHLHDLRPYHSWQAKLRADRRARCSVVEAATATASIRQATMGWQLPDAHAHPQDDQDAAPHLLAMRCTAVAVMGVKCRHDWDAVLTLQRVAGHKVIPCFGVHPWYAHQHSTEGLQPAGSYAATSQQASGTPQQPQHRATADASAAGSQAWTQHSPLLAAYSSILDVPATQDLQALEAALRKSSSSSGGPSDPSSPTATAAQASPSTHLGPTPPSCWASRLEELLHSHPRAVVGECGLDRAAVIPGTKAQVQLSHQVALLRYHLQLAALLGRPVSMHCVRSTGPMQDLLQELATAQQLPPRIMMHSFGGPPESIKQMLSLKGGVGPRLWFSFSTVINAAHGGRQKLVQRVKAVPDDRLLIESDQNSPVHMDAGLDAMLEVVAEAKGWSMQQAAAIVTRNFEGFYEWFLPEGYSRGELPG